jgi:putative addiction module antidote
MYLSVGPGGALDLAAQPSYTDRKYGGAFMAVARRKLQKVGNSTGVIVPVEMLREAGLASGDDVMVQSERGRLVITALDPGFDEMVAAADRFVSRHPNALRKLAE